MCLITRTAMTVLNVLNRIIQSIEFMLAFRINRCINVSGSGKKIPDFIFCKSYIHYLFYNVINSCYGGRSRTIIFTFFDTYSSFRGFMEIEHWEIDLNCWNKNYFCLQFYNFLHIPLNTKSNSTLYSLSINSETLAVRLIKRADCLINCWHCLNRRLIFVYAWMGVLQGSHISPALLNFFACIQLIIGLSLVEFFYDSIWNVPTT